MNKKNKINIFMILVAFLVIGFFSEAFCGDSGFPGNRSRDDFGPDLVIINGNIITVDPGHPRAEALAVYRDKIAAVGLNSDIKKFVDKNTQVIDAKGKTVTPGFIESHMHPSPLYPFENRMHIVNLFDITSMQDLINSLRAKANITPIGEWVRGERYQDTKIGGHPTRFELDQVSTSHPISISHSSGHISVVNSYVLEAADCDSPSTPDPPNPPGGEFGRLSDGTPNGILYEGARSYLMSLPGVPPLPVASEEDEKVGLYTRFQTFIQKGFTSIADASTSNVKLSRYQSMLEEGTLPLRINMLYYYGDGSNADVLNAFVRIGMKSGFGNDRLRLGTLKVFAGNSLSGRTCWLYDPYEGSHSGDNPPYYGIQHPLLMGVPPKINKIILDGHKAGFQWAVHSNGDREIDMLLDAYEEALAQYPRIDHRHRIEHASVMGKDLTILRRAKELGVILNFHPYLYEHGDKMTDYGPERWAYLMPFRSAIDLGIPVAAHSDFSVSAANPMLRIYDMVTRKSKEGIVYGPGQRVTPEEAIFVWTMGNAYASFEEQIKGSIEVGKLADIVILSADPTAVNADAIKDIQVEMTIIGGGVAYKMN